MSRPAPSTLSDVPSSSRKADKPALITSARVGRSLDAGARLRRYLITMAVRIACFGLAIVVDGVWRWVFLLAAAVLPAIAVLLANAVDLRRPSVITEEPSAVAPALTSPGTIHGQVEP